jgi:tetratricopeptide (TPR) repeat protein
MRKMLNGFLLVFAILAASAVAEETAVSDQAAIARCQQVVFWRAKTLELNKQSIMNAIPPNRLPFWNDLFPVIESSLNQRHDEALAKFIRLFMDHPRSEIGDLNYVFLMRLHGAALGKAGDYSSAIQRYDALLHEFGDNPEPDIRLQVIYVMSHRAVTFGDAGDFERKIQAFDALIDKFKNTADADVRNFVTASVLMKATTYAEKGYPEESRQVFAEAGQPFHEAVKSRKVVDLVVDLALINKNQTDEPVDANSIPSPEEAEASDIILKAMQLQKQRDPQAIVLYDVVIEKHRDSENGKLQSSVAHAMIGKAGLLERFGKDEDAAEAYRDFDAWAETVKSQEAWGTIVLGMISRGTFLERSGNPQGAVDEFDNAFNRFKDADDDMVQMLAATALLMKAKMLDAMGDAEAAYAVVVEVIETYQTHSFHGVRNIAKLAEQLRGKLIGQLGKTE